MKILQVHNYYRSSAPSGEDAVARNERQLLEEHGVEVVRFEKFNDDIDKTTLPGRIALGLNTIWSRRSRVELLTLLREVKPDLVHIHSVYPQMSPSVYAACTEAGVPVVHTLHNFRYVCPAALLQRKDHPCEACLGHWPWKALLHRCCRGSLAVTGALVGMICLMRLRGAFSREVNRFIAISEFARLRLVAGGLPAALIEVKPNFLPQAPLAVAGERENYAVYLGRLTREKGVQTLIQAWHDVKGLSLKVIGAGALRPELEALAADRDGDVQFLGAQERDAVFALVGKAQFVVVPSECSETFGMVVIEAYACGTPVLVSRQGALVEIVVEGETGLSFEAGNAAELAAQANLLAADPELAREMGRKAREIYLEKYTRETNFTRLMEIYRKAQADLAFRAGAASARRSADPARAAVKSVRQPAGPGRGA